jgi:hypothetical protein
MAEIIKIEDVSNVSRGVQIIRILRAANGSLKEAKDLWDKALEGKICEFEWDDRNVVNTTFFLEAEAVMVLLEHYGCKVSIYNKDVSEKEELENRIRKLGGKIVWEQLKWSSLGKRTELMNTAWKIAEDAKDKRIAYLMTIVGNIIEGSFTIESADNVISRAISDAAEEIEEKK